MRVGVAASAARAGPWHGALRPPGGSGRDDGGHRSVRGGGRRVTTVLLHDLGDAAGGAAWRAVAPAEWIIPDLPGHGATPAPRTRPLRPDGGGGPGPLGHRRRRRRPSHRRAGQRPQPARPRRRAEGAAAAWSWSTGCAERGGRPPRRSTRSTPASVRSSPIRVLTARRHATGRDPRTTHGYGVMMGPDFAGGSGAPSTNRCWSSRHPASPTPAGRARASARPGSPARRPSSRSRTRRPRRSSRPSSPGADPGRHEAER